ncbi:30S ribosomal protein S1 [Candidatus Palauibacter polyketidifaciens]|uniref:30S ribosomal protein S1 n=1 Tax=Candidatus Palauibacter polyketidifaciens TaxID=3056740 RepID=UPI00139ACACB|nr:30S ribosomal protein S1 [Candidatus Palauibacter polyketidifaciens]MDE2719628.1 30S ribosomal protein S1 [Candidatus Palauibacter polyketidifaciens]MYE33429.1 30S ribosomal protein S1 [Gemmatimonadales bacterium]
MPDDTNPQTEVPETEVPETDIPETTDASTEIDDAAQEEVEVAVATPPAAFEPSAIDLDLDADPRDDSQHDQAEYAELYALYEDTLSRITEGEIVSAQVIGKTETDIILDVGFKSEGAVPLEEFADPDEVEMGDSVDVLLESLEDEEGVVVLSKKKADFLRVWEKIKDAFDNNRPVQGRIKRKIKGGVTVDLMGVDAFLPGSQIALRRVPNVDDLLGDEYDFKILKLNKRRRNIVVSRRVLLEEERAGKREELKKELSVGDVRPGIVKNITDFGAFIDLGGMDGLLHITDMSWGRIGHPSEVCEIGQSLEIKILDIDWDRERISLGLKQLQEYPWKNVAEKYPVGTRVLGRVVSITNYGAFVELERGIEGLVHISEMSWTRNVRHPSQLVGINDKVECVVLRVDEEAQKISLGMKQVEEDPWLALPAQYPPGTKIRGLVRNLTSFGAFVEVEAGIDGLVHISDMSWTRRVQHPAEVLRKGEEVDVVVLSIDPDQKRISLGLKQVQEDPWYQLAQAYQPGREVAGSITRLLEKGVVVDLGSDLEGFVPISQLGVEAPVTEPADHFDEGHRLELRVLETDPINRRIVLAVVDAPDVPYAAEEVEYENMAASKSGSAADDTDEGEQSDSGGEAGE